MNRAWATMSSGDRVLWENTTKAILVREGWCRPHGVINTPHELAATLRAGPYAWPGGYQMYLMAADGEAMCFACVRANAKQVMRAIKNQDDDQWRIVACYTNWDEPELQCANCYKRIPSAYAEPDDPLTGKESE